MGDDTTSGSSQKVQTPTESKRLRLLELLLVCAVAFGGGLLYSLFAVVTGSNLQRYDLMGGAARTFYGLFEQFTALALLVYVLFRQGRSLRDIGLSFTWKDLPRSLLLALVAVVVSWVWAWTLYYGVIAVTGHPPQTKAGNMGFLQGGAESWTLYPILVYVLVNPWMEELLVRAFVMTEVRALTGRVGAAVAASVAVQVGYHFYQGVYPALSYLLLFLTFSLYYVRSGRIFPVILAHLYFDIAALLR